MAGVTYTTNTGRLEKYPGRILKKAEKREMLTKLGAMDPMPQNKSQKIEWLRFLPYGGVDNQWLAAGGDTAYITAHLITEGVTPSADSVTYTTLNTTLQQIGCLYSYTDKTRYVHEEGSEIPREMEDQAAQRLALCRELMVYGELKSCTNVFYGGTGTSVATVNGAPTKAKFQNISRDLLGKHAIMLNQTLKSGPMFGMQSVAASWPVYCHTDMEKTYENITGFTKIQDYGGRELLDPEYEIGAIGRFRVIINPLFTYQAGAGAAVGSTGLKADDSTNIDVYPQIIIGRGLGGGDAFGQVPLRGFESIDASHIPVGTKSAADPLGQRGYVGAITWQAQKILNDDWMACFYTGTEAN
jgi:N4-gp56 family major capsid protein